MVIDNKKISDKLLVANEVHGVMQDTKGLANAKCVRCGEGFGTDHRNCKPKGDFLESLFEFLDSDSGESLEELKEILKEDGIDFNTAYDKFMKKLKRGS